MDWSPPGSSVHGILQVRARGVSACDGVDWVQGNPHHVFTLQGELCVQCRQIPHPVRVSRTCVYVGVDRRGWSSEPAMRIPAQRCRQAGHGHKAAQEQQGPRLQDNFFFFPFLFFLWLCGLWDLTFLTRDWTPASAGEVSSPNHWTTRGHPQDILFLFYFFKQIAKGLTMHIDVFIHPPNPLPSRLPHNIEQSLMC